MDLGPFAHQFREFSAPLRVFVVLLVILVPVGGLWVLFEWKTPEAKLPPEGASIPTNSRASNPVPMISGGTFGDGSAFANGPGAHAQVVNNNYADLPPDSLWSKMGVTGAPDLGALHSKYPYGYFIFFAEENGPFQIQAASPLRAGWKIDVTGINASFSPGKIVIVVSELRDTVRNNQFEHIVLELPRKVSQSMASTFDEIEFMAEVVALGPRGLAGVLGFRPPTQQ